MTDQESKLRRTLLDEIRQAVKYHEDCERHAALSFARDPSDEAKAADAKRAVAKAEAAEEIRERVFKALQDYWRMQES